MPVAFNAKDDASVYTDADHFSRYIPSGSIPDDSVIREWSRHVDGRLRAKGFCVPFPAIAANNPKTPPDIVRAVSYFVAAEQRNIIKFGNRKAAGPSTYLKLAEDLLDRIISDPASLGVGRVSEPEDTLAQIASVDGAQYGKLQSPYFRLKNRNLMADTLRFVDSTGAEVFRPEGYPFIQGQDWEVHSYAEGVIAVFSESQVRSAIGADGGIVYECSWHDLSWGQSHTTRIPGVSRL